jgi:oligosaccharide repeat unit polymerase
MSLHKPAGADSEPKDLIEMEKQKTKHERTRHKATMWVWIALLASTVVLGVKYVSAFAGVGCALLLLMSAILMRKISDPLDPRRLTLLSFWYLSYLAVDVFPSFFIFADNEGPYRWRYLISVFSVLITVPLGAVLAGALRLSKRRRSEDYFSANLDALQQSSALMNVYVATLAVALVGALLYLRETPVVPLVEWLRNSSPVEQLSLLREESFKLLNSRLFLFYYLLRSVVYPFLVLVGLGCYLVTKRKTWLFLWLTALLAALIFGSMSLAKGPAANLFLVMAIFLYYYFGRRITLRLMLGSVALFFAFPLAVVLSLVGGGFFTSFQFLLERLLYLPSELLYYYFELFPSHVGYLYGGSSLHFSWLLGTKFFDTTNYVGLYYDSTMESVSAPAAFIGDLNADFGLWGVILGGIVAGWLLQKFHFHVTSGGKSVVTLACYSFLVFVFINLSVGALPTALGSGGGIPVVLLALVFERAARHKTGSLRLQAAG